MKKDHRDSTVGPWTKRKLNSLEAYLEYYALVLSKQTYMTLVYVDAFAGACRSKIRSRNVTVEAAQLFSWDDDDRSAQEEFISGSPIRALNLKHSFHQYYFYDLDESRVKTLNGLKEQYPQKSITVEIGDCNPLIRDLAKKMDSSRVRGVAFLDPYGPHLEWETVEALAATKKFEVLINFPAFMAINRLITKSGDLPDNWRQMLDACFGTPEWKDIAYREDHDLFGPKVMKQDDVAKRLLDFYLGRLKKIFAHVAKPSLIRNTRNVPLYYLIWAGPHKLGLVGAEHILKLGEKLK